MSISIDDITATKCSAFEQETVIQITKIKHIMRKDPNSYACTEVTKNKLGEVVGYAFECPKNLISYRVSVKRSISDEQRKSASKRLKEYHKKRKEETTDEK
nr:MAG TPA: hypothetical protein [Caudoviricetes sp.]